MPTPAQMIDVIGAEKYNKLVGACEEVEAYGRLRFWQEILLKRIAEKYNCEMPKSVDDYKHLFSELEPVEIKGPTFEEVQEHLDHNLPDSYRTVIAPLKESATYYFNDQKASDPEWEGRLWYLLSPKKLMESVNVGGVKKPRYQCLDLFVNLHLEYEGEDAENPDQTTWDRKRDGFVIGEDNGDYLYLDVADNGSIWIFHHDGCDATKVSESFDEWLTGARQAGCP